MIQIPLLGEVNTAFVHSTAGICRHILKIHFKVPRPRLCVHHRKCVRLENGTEVARKRFCLLCCYLWVRHGYMSRYLFLRYPKRNLRQWIVPCEPTLTPVCMFVFIPLPSFLCLVCYTPNKHGNHVDCIPCTDVWRSSALCYIHLLPELQPPYHNIHD